MAAPRGCALPWSISTGRCWRWRRAPTRRASRTRRGPSRIRRIGGARWGSRCAVAQAGVQPGDIAAIGLDTTCCSVVALDAAGEALRPALIWMDVRSAEQAARVTASGDSSLKVNGDGRGPVSAEWMIPKALWLKEREPASFERAATICEFQDYINHRLSGRMVASINNASVRWHYDARGSGYAA